MAIDLSTLFGQQPDYSSFLPDAERQRMQTNATQAAALNSAIALLAQSGRTTQPISTGQIFGSALGEAQKGYQSSMDRGIQELLTGLKIKESMAGKSPELSKEQQQYAFQKYGKAKFIDLNKPQQLDVLEFGQTPDINKALEQHIAAQKLKADTGIDLTDTTLDNLRRAQRFTQSSPSPTTPNAPVVIPQIRNFKDK
jgi:hypothetical protein